MRSNDFQDVVEIIQRLFAPQGAKITTSAMIETAPGIEREVDVLIEFTTDLYPFVVAVEAKDHARPIDITVVEQYMGKYNTAGGINANKVVIVGKSFTQPAIDRAKLLGFDLHTLNTLPGLNLGAFARAPGEKGAWWVTKGTKEKALIVRLFRDDKQQLPAAYMKATLSSATSKQALGTPESWARQIVDAHLGKTVDALFEEHAGETLHIMAWLTFQNHVLDLESESRVPLRHMLFDFGQRMMIPNMESTLLELTTATGGAKRIIHETGRGKNAAVSITHEEAGASPTKFYLKTTDQTVKKIYLRLAMPPEERA